mmetsp:Transcript_75600/g.219567  ORF Transcript_75600/g.219567 Transcript_75600/m.219567 type:complete len:278 (-) Transcript_75600:224-1057(-)
MPTRRGAEVATSDRTIACCGRGSDASIELALAIVRLLFGLPGQRLRQPLRQGSPHALSPLLRRPARLQEHLEEEPEVRSVHGDGAVHCHGLDLAGSGAEVRPHSKAINNQAPHHLGNLDDCYDRRDRFHNLRQALEGHHEEVHVHDRMHEIVRAREPHPRCVLCGQGKPAEEHNRSVMVPLQKPHRPALQDEEHCVTKFRNLRQAEQCEGQCRGAFRAILQEVVRVRADGEVETLRSQAHVQRRCHMPDAPKAEQGQCQVPDRKTPVHDGREGMLRD